MKSRWKPAQKTKEPDNKEKAYEYAVFLLSLKLRTMGEMLEKMRKRGYSEVVVEKVVEQLRAQRYVDDARYAEVFLENLKTYRTLGYYGIKKKFMEKKLPPPLIEKVLEEGLSLEQEISIAQRYLKKEGFATQAKKIEPGEVEYSTYGDNEEQKEKQKIVNKLKSRGFRTEVISRLVF